MASTSEIAEYRQFTTPAELHKAVNTLKGIVAGITTDDRATTEEVEELVNWCSLHKHLESRHPFKELLPMIEAVYADGIITADEAKDVVWLCNNFVSDASYYDLVTSSIQFLSGLMHGIMADGELSDGEIHSLQSWVRANEFLKGCYPFDEIDSLLMSVLADGKIDASERESLIAFFGNFIDLTASYNLNSVEIAKLKEKCNIGGICASCPDIAFTDNLFCFTGQSTRGKRNDIAALICDLGGRFSNNVTKETKYLIVGASGNPCWAYACYGRKIEEAMQMRKEGRRIAIVHENDFWDAVEDVR